MRITDKKYYDEYLQQLGVNIEEQFHLLTSNDEQIDLGYRIQASAVFSSNIEGNPIDLNSFMNAKMSNREFKPRQEIQEIEDLIRGYEFAQENQLNEKTFLEAHRIISQTILIKDKRGLYRNDRMGVFDSTGLVYLAIEPQFVHQKMRELFDDIKTLLDQALSINDCFTTQL